MHIDTNGRLDWETTPDFDKEIAARSDDQSHLLGIVKGEICLAEAAPLQGYSNEIKHHFVKLLGEALVHWIEGEVETSRKMVQGALGYLRERNEETSRRWYLSAGINSASLFCIAGIMAWLYRNEVITILGRNGFMLLLAACCGAVGAMLSIIVRSGNLKFSASAGRGLHYLEASSRVSAGAISGVIVFLAIKSELLLSPFFHGQGNPMLLFLAPLAAGAGERMATSIISKFDETSADFPSDSKFTQKVKEK